MAGMRVETVGAQVLEASDRAALGRLAEELLAEHAEAGASVAALVAGTAGAWEMARPLVARLVAEGWHAARRQACLVGSTVPDNAPLVATDPVPAVVWAREVGALQRYLGRLLRHRCDVGGSGGQAVALREAIVRTRAVGDALRAAALHA